MYLIKLNKYLFIVSLISFYIKFKKYIFAIDVLLFYKILILDIWENISDFKRNQYVRMLRNRHKCHIRDML